MSVRYRRKKISGLSIINIGLWLVFAILSGLMIFLIYKYHFLNFRSLNHIITGLSVFVAVLTLMMIIAKRAKRLTLTLLIIGTLLSAFGLYGLKQMMDLSDRLNSSATYTEYKMSIAVLADSQIDDVTSLERVAAPTANDSKNINALLSKLAEDKGKNLEVESIGSYPEAYQKLITGETQAIVINSAFENIIALEDPDYESKIKKIYTYTVREATKQETKETNADAFNIYISGIDTTGDVSTVSRSDVNIIMTVNRQTKKILLTTTPRDAYVKIADGGNDQYDKLTHAGLYGVGASIHTLENLYGIDINYYARLNFTSFIKLIDALGGVTVYNDQAFTSLHGNYDFPVGNINMTSDMALGFVRERYSLENGDRDRGRNQQKVIEAIIKKMTTPEALANASSIIEHLGNAVETNASLEVINSLVNDQLNTGGTYQVMSQSLEGTGSVGELPSYAMPTSSLYMMQISDESLADIKNNINKTLEGQ